MYYAATTLGMQYITLLQSQILQSNA